MCYFWELELDINVNGGDFWDFYSYLYKLVRLGGEIVKKWVYIMMCINGEWIGNWFEE